MAHQPPYDLTPTILEQSLQIAELLGEINAVHLVKQDPVLRKKNTLKTIQASLEIEGNSLTLEQVTAIFDKKRVIGPEREILEVKNAIQTYERIESFSAKSEKDFLLAHGLLMKGLAADAGKYRSKGVGIFAGSKVAHVAPPAKLVAKQMSDLFDYLSTSRDPIIIKSCVFHYEMEFIHPFSDGNGRIGRFWQAAILSSEYLLFRYLPLETLIKERQQEYYRALGDSDAIGKSNPFIEFMLEIILTQLIEITKQPRKTALGQLERLEIAKSSFPDRDFKRKDYANLFKEISSATSSRDLAKGVEEGLLACAGKGNQTVYRFV